MVLQLSKQSCSDDEGFLYRYIRVRARLRCFLKSSRFRYNCTVSQDFNGMESNQGMNRTRNGRLHCANLLMEASGNLV
ncbi:hypothetical protein CPSG_00435 [Coccidioides posadasii str. Silveira]|uniref:Uncharacterized protein n=1 Tax=Coccidioides posadasii (strain RMSCC 757 / Silveira) TaxID=443226 RepID=E9CS13_COCPS|nr:hypothetical protein CPSG_00435 [Coccidioides posadasii str. Silveira]